MLAADESTLGGRDASSTHSVARPARLRYVQTRSCDQVAPDLIGVRVLAVRVDICVGAGRAPSRIAIHRVVKLPIGTAAWIGEAILRVRECQASIYRCTGDGVVSEPITFRLAVDRSRWIRWLAER